MTLTLYGISESFTVPDKVLYASPESVNRALDYVERYDDPNPHVRHGATFKWLDGSTCGLRAAKISFDDWESRHYSQRKLFGISYKPLFSGFENMRLGEAVRMWTEVPGDDPDFDGFGIYRQEIIEVRRKRGFPKVLEVIMNGGAQTTLSPEKLLELFSPYDLKPN